MILSIFIAAACLYVNIAHPSTSQFVLQQWRAGPRVTTAELNDKRTGRIVWRKTLRGNVVVAWSADHRAIAIVDEFPPKQRGIYKLRILYWRHGERVHTSLGLPRHYE